MGDIAGGVMTARKMILLTLAILLPCGFVILLTRSVLRSSFGERFLKGVTTMRKLAFLATAVLAVAALAAGCGGGSQTTQPLAPDRSVCRSGTTRQRECRHSPSKLKSLGPVCN